MPSRNALLFQKTRRPPPRRRRRRRPDSSNSSIVVVVITLCLGLLVILFVIGLYMAQEDLSHVLQQQQQQQAQQAQSAWTPFYLVAWLQRSKVKSSVAAAAAAAAVAATAEPSREDGESLHDRFLIFKGFVAGQGTGNIMNGLLATHLLGQEFNRTVCVNPAFTDFHWAFRSNHGAALDKACRPILEKYLHHNNNNNHNNNDDDHIHHPYERILNNFGAVPDECELQRILADRSARVWILTANTYPRWPAVPDNFFFQFYHPTPALTALLPSPLPKTVVHLRTPDYEDMDHRAGLDEASLEALARHVQQQHHDDDVPYLVTNNVDFYARFPQWRHAPWQVVRHSATGQEWGSSLPQQPQYQQLSVDRGVAYGSVRTSGFHPALRQHPANMHRRTTERHYERGVMVLDDMHIEGRAANRGVKAHNDANDPYAQQHQQMWVDWYTILQARTVYHTHSDFSISAIHWQNIADSWELDGIAGDGRVRLQRESWIRDGLTPALVDRRRGGATAPNGELRACMFQEEGVFG